MPAKSKKQQMIMGAALAMKRGEMPMRGGAAKMAKHMSEAQLRDFAKTKRKGLPTRKRKEMAKKKNKRSKKGFTFRRKKIYG